MYEKSIEYFTVQESVEYFTDVNLKVEFQKG